MQQKHDFRKGLTPAIREGLFNKLSGKELALINNNSIETVYKKGEMIFKQGTKASHIAFIKKGLVKISYEENSRELVLAIENRGKILGLQALLKPGIYPYSGYACEDVSVSLFDISSFNSIILANPKFSAGIMKLIIEDSIFGYDRIACLTLKQIHGKVAHLLLFLSLYVYKKKVFITPFSKKDLALITNMSQESFSRVLSDFIADKIIEFEGNKISILDFEKIRHLNIVG
jgi:CRP/FNR family transcriptional regulator